MDIVKRFSEIFDGLSRSSGRYVVPHGAKADAHGKVLGRAWTSTQPVTLELWEAHLSGKEANVKDEETGEPITGTLGLGIVPIREDDTVVFGAIDVDVYPLDLSALQARVKELGLPVIVCRTKSGGAHVYIFTKEDAPAELVRERLSEWTVALGYPGVEIFPKQSKLSQHSGGSWINIPYSGGDRSVRYALKADGSAMTTEEFVRAVGRAAVSVAELAAFELPAEESSELFDGGPPCLQTLARVGFGEWHNNGLFNIGVYLKFRYPETWETAIEDYNNLFMVPPVGHRDLVAMIKSLKKRAYFYKCKDQPIQPVCNREVCLKRAYGVGSSASGEASVVFGDMLKVLTEPVTWVWSIDGKELEFATGDLTDQRRFRGVVIEQLSKWPRIIKPEEWTKTVTDAIQGAKEVVVPEDGTREGQFWEHLATFCTGRARARALDEILGQKAYTDVEKKRVFFRAVDLFAYLTTNRFSMTEREAYRILRRRGLEKEDRVLKGKKTTIWSVPAFSEQTEPHDVPRGAKPPEM